MNADVTIVGSGVLGLASALLLADLGCRICIVSKDFVPATPGEGFPVSLLKRFSSLGALWPSPNDPPTRTYVAHGEETTLALHHLHQFGIDKFFEITKKFLPNLQLEKAVTLRYSLENFERCELQKATELKLDLYQNRSVIANALDSANSAPGAFGVVGNFSEFIIGRPLYWDDPFLCENLFFEPFGAVFVGEENPIEELFRAVCGYFPQVTFLAGEVKSLNETAKAVSLGIRSADGNLSNLQSEVVILANSCAIPDLLPAFANILVPMVDVAFCYKREDKARSSLVKRSLRSLSRLSFDQKKALEVPVLFRGQSGHVCCVWAGANSPAPFRFSGPKFLLPNAGVGQKKRGALGQEMQTRLMDFHRAKSFLLVARALGFQTVYDYLSYLADDLSVFPTVAEFGTDTLPCDELPLVGEFGKWGRLLGSAGFLGSGLSAQCAVAYAFAELLSSGKSALLPGILSPRRFYT